MCPGACVATHAFTFGLWTKCLTIIIHPFYIYSQLDIPKPFITRDDAGSNLFELPFLANHCDTLIGKAVHKNMVIPMTTRAITFATHRKNFTCNRKFKCPGYYCLPFGYLCNGKYDCPFGEDDRHCDGIQYCEEMYKCRGTKQCIHLSDVCDGFRDCRYGEDEEQCQLSGVKCPDGCTCLHFAIYCTGVDLHTVNIYTSMDKMGDHIAALHLSVDNLSHYHKLIGNEGSGGIPCI